MTDESKCTAASGCMGAVDCICPSHGPPQRSRRRTSYLLPGMRGSHHYVHQPNPKEAKTSRAIHDDKVCVRSDEQVVGKLREPCSHNTTLSHTATEIFSTIIVNTVGHIAKDPMSHMLNCVQLLVVTVPNRRRVQCGMILETTQQHQAASVLSALQGT